MLSNRTVVLSFNAIDKDGSIHEIEVCQSVFSQSESPGDEKTIGPVRLRTHEGKPVTQIGPNTYEVGDVPRFRVTTC